MPVKPTQVILAALAAGGDKAKLDPVQMQHVLFLIDETVPEWVDGPHFEFVPGPIGPFDQSVKASILQLCRGGHLLIETESGRVLLGLTKQGRDLGTVVLQRLDASMGLYLSELHVWVHSHGFGQRLSDIQSRFPDAVTNRLSTASVRGRSEDPRRSLIQAYARQPRRFAFLKGLGRVVDLYGTLNDNDRVLGALQASRKGVVSVGDPWTEVGDYLREAMAQFAVGFPSSKGNDDVRVA